MKYRRLPKGNELLSEVGLGLGNIYTAAPGVLEKTLEKGYELGITTYDLCCYVMDNYRAFKDVLGPVRDKVYTQMHLGIEYRSGEYGRTRDYDLTLEWFEKTLEAAGTDYTDFGFIHCIDEQKDVDTIMENGIWDYFLDCKKKGMIRHLGFSTHTVGIAERFLDTGVMDLFMFSINPAYDYRTGDLAFDDSDARMALYLRAAEEGVGTTVMKPFCGGLLLDPARTPIGITLTRNQCLRYALDTPGVVTAFGGIMDPEEASILASYSDAPEEEKDYSILAKAERPEGARSCVYCNHCRPCPVGIDIGLVNKYYDLARQGDSLAADHYRSLSLNAGDCIGCGHCDEVCPFGVTQTERMEAIREYFK